MLKPKLPQQEQGFTLVEVLVAILIATIFIATPMQMMAIAAVFKARAKQFSEAINWIQQDLESVKQQTSIVGYTTLSAAPSANSLSVFSSTGFQAGNRLQIGTISNSLYTISNTYTPSSTTIPITPALTTTQITQISNALAASTPVSVSVVTTGNTNTTLCYANAQTNGFGNLLSNNLPTLNSSNNTKPIAGATYTLSRNVTVRNVTPFEVLQITYSVAQGTKPPVATLNSEVIPNAAFQCPPY